MWYCVQAATNRVPSPVAVLLWQLVAASAHIIVPIATYNLKVCRVFCEDVQPKVLQDLQSACSL